jgi:hypothetical protein
MTQNAEQSAFPTEEKNWPNQNMTGAGLTKREYLAAMAMQGYISAGSTGMPEPDRVAQLAIQTADELLKVLEQNQPA